MAEPYRYAGGLLRNDASARARDKEGMIFVRKRGKRKLTAVCSHQTRIGNLDAHLI